MAEQHKKSKKPRKQQVSMDDFPIKDLLLLLKQVPNLVLLLDNRLRIEFANHPLPGLAHKDLIGAPIISFVQGKQKNKLKKALIDVIQTGKAVKHEVEYLAPDGDTVFFDVNAFIWKSKQEARGIILIAQDITRQKKTLEQLIESEQELRLIAENSNDFIWQLGLDGKLRFISPSVAQTAGRSLPEMKKLKFREFIHPNSIKQAMQLFKAALTGKAIPPIEITTLNRDGLPTPIETSITAIRKDGKIIGVQGIARDISSRKKVEREREILFTRLQETQKLVNLGTWEWDLHADREYWSEELFHIFGRDPNKGVPHPDDYSAQYHPSDADKVLDTLKASLEQGFAETRFRLFHHEDHAERLLNLRCRVENGPDGLPARQYGTIMDITEAKQKEEHLQHLLRNLNAAQAVSHIGSWRWDIQANTLEWSDEMYRIFGIEQKSFSGSLAEVIASAIHPDDVEAVEASNRSVIEQQKPIPLEYRIIRPGGVVRTVWAEAGELITDNKGNPIVLTGVVMDITERKAAENALKESEDRFRNVFEQAAVGIIIVSPDGYFMQSNEKFCQITGYSQAELKTLTVFEITHPDDIARDEIYFQQMRSGEIGEYETEKRYLQKDGRTIWVRLYNNVKRSAAGQMEYALAAVDDITERKNIELQRDTLTQQLQDAQRIAHLGSWDWDLRTNIETWSQELFRIYGLNPEDGVPPIETHQANYHPDDRQMVVDALADSLRTGNFEIEYRIIRRDNKEIRHVHARGQVENDDGGSPIRHYGTILDITDRKMAEQELSESQLKYQSLVEDTPVMISSYSSGGRIIFANTAYCEFFGIDPQEITGINIFDTIPPGSVETVQNNLSGLTRSEPASIAENYVIRHDGVERWTRWTDRAFFNNRDQIAYFQAVGVDITDRKLAETELKKSQTILENFSDGVIRTDLKGNITFWNKAAEKIFGFAASEMDGKPVSTLWQKKDLPVLQETIRTLLAGDHVQDIEVSTRSKNGSLVPILLSLIPLKDQNGEIVELVGFSKDYSAIKYAQTALADSERTLSTLMGNLPGMVYRSENNKDWTMRFVSEGCFDLTGYHSEALTDSAELPFGQLIHPDDNHYVYETIQTAIKEKKPFELIYRIHKKDREEKWVWEKGSAVYSESGEMVHLEGFITDITQRIHAQEEIETLSKFPSENPNPVLRFSPSGAILYANTGSQTLLEKYAAEVGQKMPANWTGLIADVLHTQEIGMIEDEINGRTFSFVLAPIPDLQYVNAYGRDITIERQAQQEINAHAAFLDATMENSPFAMFIADKTGTVNRTNRTLRETLKLSDAQILGKYNVLKDQNLVEQGVMPQVEAVFSRNDSTRFTIFWKGERAGNPEFSSGNDLWIDAALFPILDEEGHLRNVVCQWVDVSEQMAANEKLRASQRQYQSVVEDSPVLIDRYSPDGTITFSNQACNQFFLGKDADLTGTSIFDNMTTEQIAKTKKYMLSFSKNNPVQTDELKNRRYDGEQRWIRWKDRALFDDSGHIIAFQSFGEEIHDRYIVEQKLKESERSLSTLMGNLPGIAYRADADEHFTMRFISEGCLELTGYTPEEMVDNGTLNFDFITHPEDREFVTKSIRHAVDEHQPYEINYRIRTRTGEEKWVWEKGSGVFSENGTLLHIEGFITDITKRKAAEAALTESEARFRTFMENFPANAYIKDSNLQHIFANRATCKFAGISMDEYAGKKTSDIYPTEIAEELEDLDRSVLDDQIIVEREGYYRSRTGEERYQRDIKFPLEGLNGEKLVGGIALDLTEQKKAQQSLQESEARFRSFMDQLPAIAYIKNEELEYVYGNRAALESVEKAEDEFTGTKNNSIFKPAEAERIESLDKAVLEHGEVIDIENQQEYINGEKKWRRDIKFPLVGLQGEKMVGGLALDLTAQKEAEKRISEKAAFERVLTETSTAFLDMDAENIDRGINNALKKAGKMLLIDRIVVSFVKDGTRSVPTHIWSEKNLANIPQTYDIQKFPWLFETSLKGNTIIWSENESLLDCLTKEEKRLFGNSGIKAFASFPIQSTGTLAGSIVFSDFENAEKFTPDLIESLRLFAQIISNAIALRDAQLAITESEARFRSFMDQLPAIAYIKNEKLEHIYGNRAALESVKKAEDEYVGMTNSAFFEPAEAQRIESLDQLVLKNDEVIDIVNQQKLISGERKWRRDIKFPLEGLHGEKLVGGIALDLTEQKKAEGKLRQQADFEQLLARISSSFLEMDAADIDNAIHDALRQAGELLGLDRISVGYVTEDDWLALTHVWSPKRIKGLNKRYPMADFSHFFPTFIDGKIRVWSGKDGLPPELTATEKALIAQTSMQSFATLPIHFSGLREGGIAFSNTKDTDIFTPEMIDSLRLFAQVIGNAIVLRDVQTAIFESEERYRSVVEDAPFFITRYQPDGTITFANQAYCDFFGKPVEDLIGTRFYNLLPKNERQAVVERLNNLSIDAPLYITEGKTIRRDGQSRWLRWTVRLLAGQKSEMGTIQAFGVDVTEQKLAAEKLAESESQYRNLFTEMDSGFTVFELEKDSKKKPNSFRFLQVNPAFEAITKLKAESIVDKRIQEVLPGIDQTLIDNIINVALHDASFHHRAYIDQLGFHADIHAFSPRHGQCAVLVNDVSDEEKLMQQVEIERDKAQRYLDLVESIIIALDAQGNISLANPRACRILGYEESDLLGRNWFDTCLPQENVEAVRKVFKDVSAGKTESVEYFENPIRTRDGQTPLIAWHNSTLVDENGKVIGLLSAGEDITARRSAEMRVQTLLDISSKLIEETYDESILQIIADKIIHDIQPAQVASIWLYDEDTGQINIKAMAGYKSPGMRDLSLDASSGIVGQILKTKKPYIQNDAQNDESYISFTSASAPGMASMQSMLCTPLVFHEKFLGMLCVGNLEKANAFSDAIVDLLESIANQLAGIVENAVLFEEIKRGREELRALSTRLVNVHEEERRLVALDLHDHFGQILATLKLSLRAEAFIKHSEAEQRARLAEVSAVVEELIGAAEDLSLRLRPAILDDLGITTAFEWHFGRFTRQTGIPIQADIKVKNGVRYPDPIEITLYRVMEESLSNASRHGDPSLIQVDLREKNKFLHMVIQDNGTGFDPALMADISYEHTGLTGIYERVRLLGGTANIDSEPEKGTTIDVVIPIIEHAGENSMEGAE